jgi:hypothetical protein
MTGMPPAMGMGMGMNMGMPGMGMQGMPGFGAGNFATNMNPMMGGGFGMGGMPPASTFATNAPPSTGGFGGFGGAPGGNFAAGPGPSADSFRKDGFNIMGKQPVKVVDEEGAKEFADLFNIADSKIKDRASNKPQYNLDYNPVSSPLIVQQSSNINQLNNDFSSMNIGGQSTSPVQ